METGNKHFNALMHQENTVLRLSARLKADSFFYAIFDDKNHMLYSGDMMGLSINKLRDHSVLNQQFDEVKIALDNSFFTFVSDSDIIDDKNELSVYLKNLYSDLDQNEIKRELINGSSIHTIYSRQNLNIKILEDHFINSEICHFSSTFIRFTRSYKEDGVYAHIESNVMHIICILKGEFQFYNQFEVLEKEDYLYHIGLVYQQFELDRSSIPLMLSGEMYPSYSSYNMLKDYFKLIEFSIMDNFTTGNENNEILPSHYFDQYLIIQ